MRVLLSAYQCQPELNSEASVGWQWAVNVGNRYETVVLTSPWTPTTRAADANPSGRLRFEYVALPKWCGWFHKPDHRNNIYYALWQFAAFLRARRLVKTERFDVVHHIVYCSTWQPTLMSYLGLPFIFGPIGENGKMPLTLARSYGWPIVIKEQLKWTLKMFLKLYWPLSRHTYRKARQVLVANSDIASRFPSWIRAKTTVQPGPSGFENATPAPVCRDGCFSVLYVGRFVRIKSPDLALRGFLKFAGTNTDVRLTMVGAGPMREDLLCLRADHPAGNRVEILEWKLRDCISRLMRECDTFLFPTLEGAGMVVLEAMSLAKPVIALAFGGPGTYLRPGGGILLPVTRPDDIVDSIAAALERLYRNPSFRQELGKQAREIYQHTYSWSAKLKQIDRVYQSACAPQTAMR